MQRFVTCPKCGFEFEDGFYDDGVGLHEALRFHYLAGIDDIENEYVCPKCRHIFYRRIDPNMLIENADPQAVTALREELKARIKNYLEFLLENIDNFDKHELRELQEALQKFVPEDE